MIQSEDQITGQWAKDKRTELGMTQTDFWAPAFCSKSMCSMYENGGNIPKTVKRLMYLHYVAGIPVTGSIDDLAPAAKEARMKAATTMRRALENIQQSSQHLNQAISIVEE